MTDEMTKFRKNALLHNLCKDWSNMWAACHDDKEKMMRLVLMQQSQPYFATFCYNGIGLSKEYCKREFGEYTDGYVFHDCDGVEGFTYQMFIDINEDKVLDSDVAHFMWCNDKNVYVKESKCPRIYVSNGSRIHVRLNGCNAVHIYIFDESEVCIDVADESCKVTVFRYSKDAKVEINKYCSADIKVFDKELKL